MGLHRPHGAAGEVGTQAELIPALALVVALQPVGVHAPVSYTHLDVYKRQEDGLPLPYGASLDVERDQVLSDYMAQELGIPASRQSWQPEE